MLQVAAETGFDQGKENGSDDEAWEPEAQEPRLWEAGQAEPRCAPKPQARVLGDSEELALVVACDVPGRAESELLLQPRSGAAGLAQTRGPVGAWRGWPESGTLLAGAFSRALSKGWHPGGERGCTKAWVISWKENGCEICKLPACVCLSSCHRSVTQSGLGNHSVLPAERGLERSGSKR